VKRGALTATFPALKILHFVRIYFCGIPILGIPFSSWSEMRAPMTACPWRRESGYLLFARSEAEGGGFAAILQASGDPHPALKGNVLDLWQSCSKI
jgi:hypothetical protein